MSFDVASVKPSKTPASVIIGPNQAPPRPPTFSLGPDDAKPRGGRFYATFRLDTFIQFAYKLAPFQTADALANTPKWLRTDRFEIEAEAQGNPTKDQMRLMMQSLLADRFQLAVHFESKKVPILALRQVKAGKLGPKLVPHSQGPPCPEYRGLDLSVAPPDPRKEVFPPSCVAGYLRGMPNGIFFVGSRNTTMATAAQTFYSYGFMAAEIDRPVVDQTGLTGTFDLVIEYKPDNNNGFPPTSSHAPDALPGAAAPDEFGGTPFVEALRQQLGLKLVRTKAPVRMLVIDHIDRLSEN
ncbi:MAG: TIGR03435 family protein [Acidobacteriia bacterium]|nr:TIGR03435 family protein [Terriglobia bacterium]